MIPFVLLFFSSHLFAETIPSVVSLTDLQVGETVLVRIEETEKATAFAFLSAKCPCSQSHEKKLSELCEKFKARGIRCIGVHSNANETDADSKKYFDKERFSFPVFRDEGARFADQIGALKTPHVFIVNKKGAIIFSGGIDNSRDAATASEHYLETAFLQIAENRKLEPKMTRALGCFIARP